MKKQLLSILILFLAVNLFAADADTKRLNDPAFCKLFLPLSNNYKDASGNGNATALVGTETYQTGPFGKDRFYFNGSSRVTFSPVATNTVSWWSGTSHYAIVGASFYVNGKTSAAFTRILNHTNIGSGFTGNAWNGRAYNVDLSASEVSALYRMEQFVPKLSFNRSLMTNDANLKLLLWNGIDYSTNNRRVTNYKVSTGNGVMKFNGSDSYLSTQNILTNNFTIVAWFRPNSLGEGSVGRMFRVPSSCSLSLASATKLTFTQNTSLTTSDLNFRFPQWNCVTVTVTSSNVATIYLNGLAVTNPTDIGLGTPGAVLIIGNANTEGTATFDGYIGPMLFYSGILSSDRILEIYNGMRTFF